MNSSNSSVDTDRLPCPFCAGVSDVCIEIIPKMDGNVIEAYVRCRRCKAQSHHLVLSQENPITETSRIYGMAVKTATADWNTRNGEQEVPKDIDLMEKLQELI